MASSVIWVVKCGRRAAKYGIGLVKKGIRVAKRGKCLTKYRGDSRLQVRETEG